MADYFDTRIDACAKRRGFTPSKKRALKKHARKALNRLVRDNHGVRTSEIENEALKLAEEAVRRENAIQHADANKIETMKLDAAYDDEARRADALLGMVNENEGGHLTVREALSNGGARQLQEVRQGEYISEIEAYLPPVWLPLRSDLTRKETQQRAIEAALTGAADPMTDALRRLRTKMTDDANDAIGVPDYVPQQDNPLPNLARLFRRDLLGDNADAWIEKVQPRVENSRAELLNVWERAKDRGDDMYDDKSLDDLMGPYITPRTADDFTSLAREFTGSDDLHALYAREINSISRNNAVWKIFGKNAERNLNKVADGLLKDAGRKNKLKAAFYNLRGTFDIAQEISANRVVRIGQKSARAATSAGRAATLSYLDDTFIKQHLGALGRLHKTNSIGQGNLRGMVSALDAWFRGNRLLSQVTKDPRLEDFAREMMLDNHANAVRLYQNGKLIGEVAEGYYGDGVAEKAVEFTKRVFAKGTLGLTDFHGSLRQQQRSAVRGDMRGLTRLAKKYYGKTYDEFLAATTREGSVFQPFSYTDRALWQESRWGRDMWDALQAEMEAGTAFNADGFLSPGRFGNRWLQTRFGMRANAKAAQFSGYIADSTQAAMKLQSNPGSAGRLGGDFATMLMQDMTATTGTVVDSVTKPLVYGGVTGSLNSVGFAGIWTANTLAALYGYYQIKHYRTYGEWGDYPHRDLAAFVRRGIDLEVLGLFGAFYQTRYDDDIVPTSAPLTDVAAIATEVGRALDPTDETRTWEFVRAVVEGEREDVERGAAAILSRVPIGGVRDIAAATVDPDRDSILQR